MRARCEEERRPGAGHVTVAEGDRPDARQDERLAARRAKLAVEGPAVPPPAVRIDAATAEIGHEEVASVGAEPVRRDRQPPRLGQGPLPGDAGEETAVEIDLVHVAASRRV